MERKQFSQLEVGDVFMYESIFGDTYMFELLAKGPLHRGVRECLVGALKPDNFDAYDHIRDICVGNTNWKHKVVLFSLRATKEIEVVEHRDTHGVFDTALDSKESVYTPCTFSVCPTPCA